MTRRPLVLLALPALLALGCYDSHVIDVTEDGCPLPADLTCVRQQAGPCSRWVEVDPVCDAGAWACAGDSRPHAAVEAPDTCLPLHDGPFDELASAGVVLEDGDRCLWVVDEGRAGAGARVEHAGLYPEDLPFGACPGAAGFVGDRSPDEVVEAPSRDLRLLSLRDSATVGGRAEVFYREYAWDDSAVFGVSRLGSGVAAWDPEAKRIRIGDSLVWGDGWDFGDTSLLWHDDTLYVYSCSGPLDFLTYGCALARLPEGDPTREDGYEYWSEDAWSPDVDDASIVFFSGPERASVREHPRGGLFHHVFIAGFGDTVEIRRAPTPEGPWSDAETLVRCELPEDDEDAFCREPLIHVELADPLEPDVLVVHYDIDTLAPDREERRRRDPEAYWPRLVRVPLPRDMR